MTSLALASFTLSLGACGDNTAPADPDPITPPPPTAHGDARFAVMGWLQRERAIERAIEADQSPKPFLLAMLADGDTPSGCPARAVSGDTVTYTASACTTAGGLAYDGELITHNVASPVGDDQPALDETGPVEIDMNAFTRGGETFDGTLRRSGGTGRVGSTYTQVLDYAYASADDDWAVQIAAACTLHEDASDCALDGTVDSRGGSYVVDGQVEASATRSHGALELRGGDTLAVDFDAIDVGCAPYTIDDVFAGDYCFQDHAGDTIQLYGYGGGCDVADDGSATYSYDVWLTGDAERATVLVIDALGVRDERAMTFQGYDAGNQAFHWTVAWTDADTALTCDRDAMTMKLTVVDADGGYDCAGMGRDANQWWGAGCRT